MKENVEGIGCGANYIVRKNFPVFDKTFMHFLTNEETVHSL